MQSCIEIKLNPSVSQAQIYRFLKEVDADFPVALSAKTPLPSYADKLHESADLVVLFDGSNEIKGLAAGYIRNSVGPLAYLTLLAISKDFRGSGMDTALVKRFVEYAQERALLGVHLYADISNVAELRTYDKLGFTPETFSDEPRPKDVHLLKLINKTVLVTAIGSFSASCVIDSLHAKGFRVVGCDIYPREWIANSLKVDAFYQVPLASDGVRYLDALAKIISFEKIGYLIPLTDYEVDALREKDLATLICVSPAWVTDVCRDKYSCYKQLQKYFANNLIPTQDLSDANLDNMKYPVICKPKGGRSSEGLMKAGCGSALEAMVQGLDRSSYCVQPEIQGNVVTVDVVRDPISGRAAAIPREELIRTKNGAGVSVRVFNDSVLIELAKSIAERLGVQGCVNLEFIAEDSSSYRFLECNPRFSGGVEFSCIAGYDCVVNHLRCFLGLLPEAINLDAEIYIARSYKAFITERSDIHKGVME